MRLIIQKLKKYHQTINQSFIQYYTEIIKLIQHANSQMSESTRVQYLVNSLLSSLSIETRRSYSKRAEELTSLSNTFVPLSMFDDESSNPAQFAHRRRIDQKVNKDQFDYNRENPSN